VTVATALKRKTSLTLDASALDEAREMGLNVSALADEALKEAVRKARQQRWLEENAEAFKAQSEWHEKHGHPLADIIAGPGKDTWMD
jgi:antitoxin CcdA